MAQQQSTNSERLEYNCTSYLYK